MVEYAAKFQELSCFAPDLVGTERLRTIGFFEGLNLKYQRRVCHCTTFQELYDRALERAWINQKDGNNFKRKEFGKTVRSEPKKLNIAALEAAEGVSVKMKAHVQDLRCGKCGKAHYGRNCTGQGICYKCKQVGHKIKDFP